MCKKVSVIIPTYKRSQFLVRAINSVKNQTYKNIEIIVVDDNDPFSEYRKENELKMNQFSVDDNILYLKHEKNKNGAAARNTGIKRATGDYITFLDDDDYFLPDRIGDLVDLLENNPNYDGAYSSVALLQNNKILDIISANKNGNFKLDVLRQKSFFGTGSNMFFTKKIIDKIGFFDEEFIRHQDMEYMIRFFRFSDIIGLNKVSVVKCVDDKGNLPNFEKLYGIKKLFFNKFSDDINEYNEEKKLIYFDNYLELLSIYDFNKKKYEDIISELKTYTSITFKMKLKIFYKLYLRKIKIIKFLNFIRKKVKCKKKCSNELEKEIILLSKLG